MALDHQQIICSLKIQRMMIKNYQFINTLYSNYDQKINVQKNSTKCSWQQKNLSKRKEKAIPRTVSSRSKIISNPCVKNNQITKTHFLLIDYRRSQRKQGKTPGLTIIYNDCKLNEKKSIPRFSSRSKILLSKWCF